MRYSIEDALTFGLCVSETSAKREGLSGPQALVPIDEPRGWPSDLIAKCFSARPKEALPRYKLLDEARK
ncbi:hypothetical protein KCU98_g64, partial [Aureobasidium melanogenum]